MLISTMRLQEPLRLQLCVHGAIFEIHVETKQGSYVAHAVTAIMGSRIELRRSILGVNFVQPDQYPDQMINWNISEEIRVGLKMYPS